MVRFSIVIILITHTNYILIDSYIYFQYFIRFHWQSIQLRAQYPFLLFAFEHFNKIIWTTTKCAHSILLSLLNDTHFNNVYEKFCFFSSLSGSIFFFFLDIHFSRCFGESELQEEKKKSFQSINLFSMRTFIAETQLFKLR